MTTRNITIGEEPCLLVVEGRHDKAFFEVLLQKLDLHLKFQIIEMGGKDNLRNRLAAITLAPNFRQNIKVMGVIRDADDNSDSAFQSLCDHLRNIKLSVPSEPFTIAGGQPKTTIAILPSMSGSGGLEELCLTAFEDDPAMACVDQYFVCLREHKITIRDTRLTKSRLATLIASKDVRDFQFSVAIQQGWWPWQSAVFNEVKVFLNQIASAYS